jgi:hypothetical protein
VGDALSEFDAEGVASEAAKSQVVNPHVVDSHPRSFVIVEEPAWPPMALAAARAATLRTPHRRSTLMGSIGILAGLSAAVLVGSVGSLWRTGGMTMQEPPVTAPPSVSQPVAAPAPVMPDAVTPDATSTSVIAEQAPARAEQPPARTVARVPANSPGVLFVESRPSGATVHFDGRRLTTTPFQLSDVPPGPHTIRMELDGYLVWSAPITIEAGARARIAASLEPATFTSR